MLNFRILSGFVLALCLFTFSSVAPAAITAGISGQCQTPQNYYANQTYDQCYARLKSNSQTWYWVFESPKYQGYNGSNQKLNSMYFIPGGSCPANSTYQSAGCVCNSGYNQNGNVCEQNIDSNACLPGTTPQWVNGQRKCIASENPSDTPCNNSAMHRDPISGLCKGNSLPDSPSCPGQMNSVDWSGNESCIPSDSCNAPNTQSPNGSMCQKVPATNGQQNADGTAKPDTPQPAAKAQAEKDKAEQSKTDTQAAAAAKQSASNNSQQQSQTAAAASQAASANGTTSATAIEAAEAAAKAAQRAASDAVSAANAAAQQAVAESAAAKAETARQAAAQFEAIQRYTEGYSAAKEAENAANEGKGAYYGAVSGKSPTGSTPGSDGTADGNCPDCAKEVTQKEVRDNIKEINDGIKTGDKTTPEVDKTGTFGEHNERLINGLKQRFPLPDLGTIDSDCPVFTKHIPFLNVDLVIDQHCTLEADYRPILEGAAALMWSIMGLLIVLGA